LPEMDGGHGASPLRISFDFGWRRNSWVGPGHVKKITTPLMGILLSCVTGGCLSVPSQPWSLRDHNATWDFKDEPFTNVLETVNGFLRRSSDPKGPVPVVSLDLSVPPIAIATHDPDLAEPIRDAVARFNQRHGSPIPPLSLVTFEAESATVRDVLHILCEIENRLTLEESLKGATLRLALPGPLICRAYRYTWLGLTTGGREEATRDASEEGTQELRNCFPNYIELTYSYENKCFVLVADKDVHGKFASFFKRSLGKEREEEFAPIP
jgi:hypothetical protein